MSQYTKLYRDTYLTEYYLDIPVFQYIMFAGMFMGNRQIIASGRIVVSRILLDTWNKLSEYVVCCHGRCNRLLLFVD